MIKRISKFALNFQTKTIKTSNLIKKDFTKKPLLNIFLGIFVFVLLIALSNFLQQTPKAEESENLQSKQVQTYSIGSVPRMTVQAQIEKSGVMKIVALSGGVVQKIYYREGEHVNKGNTIVSLSSNYQGGNAFSVQRQLAQTQYNSSQDTYSLQKDLISKQRDIATASAENAQQLRDITNKSLDDTRNLLSLNETMLRNVETSIEQLQQNPQADQSLLQTLQSQRAQLLAATSQTRSGLRASEYQAANDKPPALLANLQKDLLLKQLELQEKSIEVNKEVSKLQLQLAQVTEGLMYPAAPFNGVIQRIYVREFDSVAPGTLLALIVQDTGDDPINAVAYVPLNIAQKVSHIEPSTLHLGNQTYQEYPYFTSIEAVQGNSYAVYYNVPESFTNEITDKSYIEIEMPVGYADSSAASTYVPIDSIYQTQDTSYLFIVEKGKAKSVKVTLGNVYGNFVEVIKGLHDGDQVIKSRNVIDGDSIQVTR